MARVFVNGTLAMSLPIESAFLHGTSFSFAFESRRTTFKFECHVKASDCNGTAVTVAIPQAQTDSDGTYVAKHLRDPQSGPSGLHHFSHKLELPSLPERVTTVDLLVQLPSQTTLQSVTANATPVARCYDSGNSLRSRFDLPDFDYVIYTTAASFDGEHLPLRSHYIARALAAAGYTTGYIPSSKTQECRKVADRLYQFDNSSLKALLSDLCRQKKPGVFIVSSKPDVVALGTMQTLSIEGWKVIYEVRDDMGAMHAKGFSQYYAPEFEKFIATRANLVSCVSEPIAWKLKAFGVQADKIVISPNGVEAELVPSDLTERLCSTKQRRMVYFGHMYPQRFDKELVKTIAQRYSDYQIDLYGIGCAEDDFRDFQNIRLHGYTSVDDFLRLSRDAAVGLLPFLENPITFALSPIKYPQYLCAGLKVVSSDVYQLRGKPLCFSDCRKTFLENLADALAYTVTTEDARAVSELLYAYRWDATLQTFLDHVNRLSP